MVAIKISQANSNHRAKMFCIINRDSLRNVEEDDLRVAFDEPSAAVDLLALLAGALNSLKRFIMSLKAHKRDLPGLWVTSFI